MKPRIDSEQRLGVVGTTGIDLQGRGRLPKRYNLSGRKFGVSYSEIETLTKTGITVVGEAPGNTASNFAIGSGKLREGTVVLFAPISITDDSSHLLRTTFQETGVELRETPYDGPNPLSLVVPKKGDRVILTAKPENAPPITDFDSDLSYLMIANGSLWVDTFRAAKGHVTQYGIPHGVLGSQSQIDQLHGDPEKKEAYFRLVRGGDFFGNNSEIRGLLEVLDIRPSQGPHRLLDQFRQATDIRTGMVTFGPRGIIYADPEGNHHTLYTKPLPKKEVSNSVGSGDGTAASMKHSIDLATTPETALVNAAKAGANIARYQDALTGQPTAEDWDRRATATNGLRYEIYTPKDRAKNPVAIWTSGRKLG